MLATATDARAVRASRLRGLYAVTPDIADTLALREGVGAAITGGAQAVQYRNKTAPREQRVVQARVLAELCRSRDVLYIVNDDVELAAEVGADGVHLGRDDGDPSVARLILGPGPVIGVSCYDDIARARVMADAGADYVAFGSLYPSSVKPAATRASLGLLGRARSLGVRIVGIGGIDAENAADVIEAGADAVAVINAVFGADDIEAAARDIALACERSERDNRY
jgi:thiamine-phosphate pyrophosphorylase